MSKKTKRKPTLSLRDKAALRRIMKTVRNIRVWKLAHK